MWCSNYIFVICRLEKLVLGDGSDLLHDDDSDLPSCSYSLRMEDSGVEEGDYSSSPQISDTLDSPERSPAWVDEDDINLWYVIWVTIHISWTLD